ncbi:unnamed protein product [Brassicogethes aeneus]|uniref:DUF243 domain-containing protein n=1 Tax=Brassicogethes aeneus TaxID=1431903 RepID=A0A9P0FAM4_BRAAE|nr:unnamed protein product [Brassicogethes aeneus]
MRSILLTFCLMGLTMAHPQGYNYPKQTSGGAFQSEIKGEEGYSKETPSGPVFDNEIKSPVVAPAEEATSASLPVQIFKHVYVHVAPDEPEQIQPKVKVTPVAPQKHYKIIFVKAPDPPTYVAPVIPSQVQDEEKTLVYVLVRRPDAADDIVVPTPAPTKPSKPEVFFIKYKTQKEEKQEVVNTEAPKVEKPVTDSYKGSLSSGPARGAAKYGPPSRKYLPQKKRY